MGDLGKASNLKRWSYLSESNTTPINLINRKISLKDFLIKNIYLI